MRYEIQLAESAQADADRISAFQIRTILSQTQVHLAFEPLRETRNRKPIRIDRAPFHMRNLIRVLLMGEIGHDPWELRIGRWRVIYVVGSIPAAVRLLRIFEKPDHLDFMTALRDWVALD